MTNTQNTERQECHSEIIELKQLKKELMACVRGKLGGPCALFVNHFGQRHSEVDHPFLFRSLRIVRTLAVPAVLQVVVKLNVVTLTR